MSKLNELIEKAIHDIQFNGCTLPESIIRLRLDNIVACAKLEESIERNQKYLESLQLDSAHGHGGNDRPNVIGDMITEPEQVGRWYQCIHGSTDSIKFTKGQWYFCPTNEPSENDFINNHNELDGWGKYNNEFFDLTNPQLNNPDAEPENYINPITN